jgi:hypothetical protein
MNVLVVLSAKLINNELRHRFGDIPSVLTPFKNKTILDAIYTENSTFYDKIIILCGENKEQIHNYISNLDYGKIELINIENTESLADSTLVLDNALNFGEIENLSLIFGDTYVSSSEINYYLNRNVIFTSEVNDSSRWTIVNDEGLSDKKTLTNQNQFSAIIGYFNFTQFDYFIELLRESSFYDALLGYREKYNSEYICSSTWIDVGHEDTYINSKKNKTRFFNTINIDYNRGILRKSSTNKQKLINEIEWFLKLPNNISYLTPRIFTYSLEYEDPFVEMEYYSYETLHEMYFYGNLNEKEWEKIYNNLFKKLEVMKKFTYYIDKNSIDESLRKMYIEKTRERLNGIKGKNEFKGFFEDDIYINGNKYPNLNDILNKVSYLYNVLNINELQSLSIIHGDYFFANILYDNINNIVRLIDPRGDFAGHGIYGDFRYDLAKLLHSVEGKYDLIVEDSFKLEVSGNKIDYNFIINRNQYIAENIFNDFLKEKCLDLNQIRFIESILFLSMIPLHEDNYSRQIVMMCRGIELIYQLEGVVNYVDGK